MIHNLKELKCPYGYTTHSLPPTAFAVITADERRIFALVRILYNFAESPIEFIAVASFLSKEEKLPYVKVAIRKTDTLKVLLMVLWETKSLDNKKYIDLSVKIDEIGKMLGGWNGQLSKQNSPAKKQGEK